MGRPTRSAIEIFADRLAVVRFPSDGSMYPRSETCCEAEKWYLALIGGAICGTEEIPLYFDGVDWDDILYGDAD